MVTRIHINSKFVIDILKLNVLTKRARFSISMQLIRLWKLRKTSDSEFTMVGPVQPHY